jgi:hypothetical protein
MSSYDIFDIIIYFLACLSALSKENRNYIPLGPNLTVQPFGFFINFLINSGSLINSFNLQHLESSDRASE